MLELQPHRSQLQMLAQLRCRALARRDALLALARELAPTEPPDADFAADPHLGGMTILIADENRVCRAIAADILGNLGCQVLCHEGDPCAWPVQERLDLTLLDVPFWNAMQRRRVRQAKQYAERLIVATPLPEGPALIELRAAGAAALVRKPYQTLELRRCVAEVLRAD